MPPTLRAVTPTSEDPWAGIREWLRLWFPDDKDRDDRMEGIRTIVDQLVAPGRSRETLLQALAECADIWQRVRVLVHTARSADEYRKVHDQAVRALREAQGRLAALHRCCWDTTGERARILADLRGPLAPAERAHLLERVNQLDAQQRDSRARRGC